MKVKNILKSKMVQNGLWLYALQLFNSVIPLLTLPYITRILGPSQYGVFSYALNIITYFQVFVEYGFGLSGARKVAIRKSEKEVERLFSIIVWSRCLLCSLSAVLLFLTICGTNMDEMQIKSLGILFLMILGTVFQQTWIFQGLQIMQYITITNVISRTASVVLIFVFVKKADQILLYSLLYSITNVINGLVGVLFVKIKLHYKLQKVTLKEIIEEIKEGWYTFTTSIMTKIFTGIGVTILGYYGTKSDVGIYSAIQKIPQIMVLLFDPIGKVIYPYVSTKFEVSFSKGIEKIKKISFLIIFLFCIIGTGIIIIAKPLILLLYGKEFAEYSVIIVPLILWLIASITNNLLGIQILVGSGHLKEYSKAFRIGVIAIIICNLILGKWFTIYGIAVASFISEGILTIALIFQIKKVMNIEMKLKREGVR